jgi:hypothetical protein
VKSAIITRFHETHITDYKITTMVSQSDLINQSMEITDYEITPIHFTEENLIQKLNEMSVECRASVIRLLNREQREVSRARQTFDLSRARRTFDEQWIFTNH